MDILADKLRGYLGLVEDLFERRDKVMAACEALMPHLYHVARTTADPNRLVPIGYWMHRGGVPFVSFEVFENVYWATMKPIVEELWADGFQTLFYAEGNWDHHLASFAALPAGSIVYHVDQGDVVKAHRVLGEKFCLSGGVPNYLLAVGTPDQVRRCCKKIIDGVAGNGGYIMDASAIVQNDARVENVRAMTDFTREYGVYSSGSSSAAAPPPVRARGADVQAKFCATAAGRRAACASRGSGIVAECPHSPATKPSSSGCGRTSTPWRTCSFGRFCSRFRAGKCTFTVPLSLRERAGVRGSCR